jgi:Na+-transporting methylmalonyl-CoA/oxaloacetate decarboxylase gamma subunit
MLERYMEATKRKPLGTRPKASRRKVKLTETNIEDKKIRNEVSSVLNGLVYLTDSVAKLEGTSRPKTSQTKASRPKSSRRKVKANEVKATEANIEDKKIRNEVSSVLDGLVYLTESVAKLEGTSKPKASQPKASQPKASQPKASQPKASRRKVKATEANIEDKKIRNEVSSVLDGLVYLTESVAKLERRPRTRSANSVTRSKSKNLTRKPRTRPVSSRSRKSESNVIKGIRI